MLNLSFAILHDDGFQQEIDRLTQVLAQSDVKEQFIASVSHIDNFVGYLFIAYITVLAGIISTPVISIWIVVAACTGNVFFGAAVNTVRGVGGSAASKLS